MTDEHYQGYDTTMTANTATLDELNQRFGMTDQLRFTDQADGAIVAAIKNSRASAQIALQGAQMLAYQPLGAAPVLWTSAAARWVPGKSLRGGVPVCWPWFGPHPDDPAQPAHGYARGQNWEVRSSSAMPQATHVVLGLPPRADYQRYAPYAANLDVELAVSVGAQLRMTLTTRNTGADSVPLTQALHTYFRVSDIGGVRILGLEDHVFIDKVAGGRATQRGTVQIDGEVDRIYVDTDNDCLIDDAGLQRRIRIAHTGSRATVVWNPWIAKSQQLGDMDAEGYRQMLCVETANAADDARQLAPGATQVLSAVISLEAR